MRTTLRSFAFGVAGMLGLATMAQYPYIWSISGSVGNCYPGQTVNVQTIQGTQPAYNFNIPVDENTCTYSIPLGISSSWAMVQVSTMCNGAVLTAFDTTSFNFINDSAFTVLNFSCNGMTDCNGVLNGPDMPGSPCDDGNALTVNDTWAPWCQCIGDSSAQYDCLGIYQGQNLPGTFCINFMGDTGLWNVNCECVVNGQIEDCNGVLNGPAMPGTACDDGLIFTTNDTWTVDCICIGDSGNVFQYDCNGVLNGPDVPGTPCIIPGTTIEGTWSMNCVCEENNPVPCQANFWVLQAWQGDSNNVEPIPYELWLWNLSSGGSGVYTYLWNFGDGTSSTDPFPTHTYSDNGPYNLCLTINDDQGCTSTYCDSVSIDDNGYYTGMVGEVSRNDGFTINVQNGPMGVNDVVISEGISTWPNPAVDELNVAVIGGMRGVVNLTVTDIDGRVVLNEQRTFSGERTQLQISTKELSAGIYTVRLSNAQGNVSQRFVKTR